MHRFRGYSIFFCSALATFVGCSTSDDSPAAVAGAGGGVAGGEAGASNGGDAGLSEGGNAEGGADDTLAGVAGPADAQTNMFHHPVGVAKNGRDVFRFETFGNEGFWTRALRLPQGMVNTGLTTVLALQNGINIDIENVPSSIKSKVIAEAKTNLSEAKAPLLNDPATFMALVEANAVVGLSARNVLALNGTLDINEADVFAGESVGVSCAFCHSVTDGSVLSTPHGGGIGVRQDGRANHDLNFGASIAIGESTRTYYPTLALDLVANKHMSVSRKGPGVGLISKAGTEEEVDAFLSDPDTYPIGMFDDAVDGNGAPMHNSPLFRADLGAPWGSDGSIEMLQNFSNLVFTALLDPTDLTTEGGRKFLKDRGGDAGVEIADNYVAILAALSIPAGGVNGYPFVGRAGKPDVAIGLPAGAKVEDSLIGMRVDDTKLFDMNAYLNSQPAPEGDKSDVAAIARGRNVFRQQCTTCHNDDQSRSVPQNLVPFNDSVEFFENAPPRPALFPGYVGKLVADRSASRLAPVRDSLGIFDDKMVIVDASNRNQPRGNALPLLLDLARKPSFLHDDSVPSLSKLLDPVRGKSVPHPFYVADEAQREDVVTFLKSLDDQP